MPTKHRGGRYPFDKTALSFDAVSTAAWGTGTQSGTVLDTGAISPDETGKKGYQIRWPGIASGGAATVQFVVQTDDALAFGSPTTIETSRAFAYNASEPGPADYLMPIPSEHERYLRLQIVIGGVALTGGAVTAGIVPLP